VSLLSARARLAPPRGWAVHGEYRSARRWGRGRRRDPLRLSRMAWAAVKDGPTRWSGSRSARRRTAARA